MLHEDEVSPAPAPKLEAKRGSQHRSSSPTYGPCSSKDINMRVRTILCPNGDRCKLSQKQSAEDQPTSHARAKPAPSSARARNTHHQALALVAEHFLSKESQRRARNINESITAKCVNRRDVKLQKLDFNRAATVAPEPLKEWVAGCTNVLNSPEALPKAHATTCKPQSGFQCVNSGPALAVRMTMHAKHLAIKPLHSLLRNR
jgi:hypothetical protein